MSGGLPAVLDVWRAVAARRCFDGVLPLSGFKRLQGSLVDTDGDCRFRLEFGRDPLNLGVVEVRIEAKLPLQCQRSLERYLQPVNIVQRLGLIIKEAQEAALPPDTEPLLLDESGQLHPLELLEDELILALPLVPINPDAVALATNWTDRAADQEREVRENEDQEKQDHAKPHPFAALAALKGHKT